MGKAVSQTERSSTARVRKWRLLQAACTAVLYSALGVVLLEGVLQPLEGMAFAQLSMMIASHEPSFTSSLAQAYDPARWEESEPEPEPAHINASEVTLPKPGERYGQVSCESSGLDAPVYWDDTEQIMARGVGQNLLGLPPGFGQLIILAGHNTTYFAPLYNLKVGDVISFQTDWCPYEYTVTKIEVYNEDDLDKLLKKKYAKQQEELVMYTCWPEYVVTWRKTDRLAVFATRTQGLDVW